MGVVAFANLLRSGIQPSVLTGRVRYNEQRISGAASPAQKVLEVNPNRFVIIAAHTQFTSNVAFATNGDATPTRGIFLLHPDETLVLDFDKWGPILGYNWYIAGSGSSQITITEGLFLPC